MDTPTKKGKSKLWILLIALVVAFAIFMYVKKDDSPSKSPIEGVSDEVYEQIVQFYFYIDTTMDAFKKYEETGESIDPQWYEDHELYKEAVAYTEKHEDVKIPSQVFPNPLFYEYGVDPEQFSETEQKYFEQLMELLEFMQHFTSEGYDSLRDELKEELQIKDAYNPFDEDHL